MKYYSTHHHLAFIAGLVFVGCLNAVSGCSNSPSGNSGDIESGNRTDAGNGDSADRGVTDTASPTDTMRVANDTTVFDANTVDSQGIDVGSNTMDALADAGAPPSLPDQDSDGVPDSADIAPNDPELPGTVAANRVYACTEDELWSLDPKTYALEYETFFDWPSDGNIHRMTDLAIDQWGVLYGVSFSTLYTCHPKTGICTQVGELPLALNALTLVPGSEIGEDSDVLIGIGGGGEWLRLDLVGASFASTQLGKYGSPYTSSGDAYSSAGLGTFASVNRTEEVDDYIIEIDPSTGTVIREVGRVDGFTAIYGLAGWNQRAFAFDESGTISVLDTDTGVIITTVTSVPKKWWGAAVPTLLPTGQ